MEYISSMNLGEFLEAVSDCKEKIEIRESNDRRTRVSGLEYDSRRCGNGCLFFCKGEKFSARYAEEAQKKGAVAIIYPAGIGSDAEKLISALPVTVVKVRNISRTMAIAAARFYGDPMSKMRSIAVTGTKGKTTAVHYINSVLGKNPEIKSGILNDFLDENAPRLTTPEAIDFHKAARNALDSGCTHIVCEISSQAQKTERTYGIRFDYGCFLNLGTDHISPKEHKDMEEYYGCKASLIRNCSSAVINTGDPYGKRLYDELPEEIKKITFSVYGKDADFYAGKITEGRYGCDFRVYRKSSVKGSPIMTSGAGKFNSVNALCAYAVCRTEGLSERQIFCGILEGKPKGRCERFETFDGKITVVVDYAHNAMSFEGILESVGKTDKNTPVTVIFGCPGDKAFCRREELAKICSERSDAVVICDDDGGKEGYENISREMSGYFLKYTRSKKARLSALRISFTKDRKLALRYAMENAAEKRGKSMILMLGKGAEEKMKTGDEDVTCESDLMLAENEIKRYDTAKNAGDIFRRIKRRSKDKILVKLGRSEAISREFALSLPYLRKYGIGVCGICDVKDSETVRQSCFKEGIACVLYRSEDQCSEIKAKISADMRMGILPLVTYAGDGDGAVRKMNMLCKFDDAVYLEENKGILETGIGRLRKLTVRRAEIIARMTGSSPVSEALEVLKHGINEVALIDGTSSKALACYALGTGYKGTVITERKKVSRIPERKNRCADLSDSVTEEKETDR